MDFHSLPIKSIQKETSDAVSITFEVPAEYKKSFSFAAGQYLTLEAEINGEKVRRAYSIWKAPFENEISVLVKKIEDGKFSCFANNGLAASTRMSVAPPIGNFKLVENGKALTLFSAGSGITPIISIIKQQLFNGQDNKVVLFYVNRNQESVIFKDELDKLVATFPNQLTVHHLFTREENTSNQFSGRIDAEKCKELSSEKVLNLKSDDFYMCGPEEMILSVKNYLLENQVDEKKIHFELFSSSLPTDNTFDSSIEKATVFVTIDDDEFEYEYTIAEADSLLEAGNDSGLDLPFSCKGGVCCTCKAKVMEGEAKMIKNYALSEEEVADGYILTCQAHPTTEKLVISFDE
ncbi:MAG: 2Fe-2S iron-sulfur cluster binding domain-containing protein [Fluviicola sp.]|nr:2Fe-2S iron-sulfur cluster binding domain-containing protein [Fluviicola sp.]